MAPKSCRVLGDKIDASQPLEPLDSSFSILESPQIQRRNNYSSISVCRIGPSHYCSQKRKSSPKRILLDRDSPMAFKVLLLLALLAHHATSTHRDLNRSIITNASNRIFPHCFTPMSVPGIKETNLTDCNTALRGLARQPDFRTRFVFSKNTRRGLKVPRGWLARDCVIIISCENDRDAFAFRYADVLVIAKLIVENCVEREQEGFGTFRWGGVDQILDSETFYVSVGKPSEPIPSSTGIGSLMLENLTDVTRPDQVA